MSACQERRHDTKSLLLGVVVWKNLSPDSNEGKQKTV